MSSHSPILSVIIPAYNEEKTIQVVLDKVVQADVGNLQKEIIVINDGSTDHTRQAVEEFIKRNPSEKIYIENLPSNRGKGASLHRGIELAGGEYLIIQDADLEYDPNEYIDLLNPILQDHADVVYGSRFMGARPHRILFFWHTVGNRFLTFLSNILTNLNLTDMETCYKCFRTELLKGLRLKEKRFGFEPEITAKISRIPGIRIYEVGISYYGRKYEDGKKIKWKDGFRALYCIFKYNIFSKK